MHPSHIFRERQRDLRPTSGAVVPMLVKPVEFHPLQNCPLPAFSHPQRVLCPVDGSTGRLEFRLHHRRARHLGGRFKCHSEISRYSRDRNSVCDSYPDHRAAHVVFVVADPGECGEVTPDEDSIVGCHSYSRIILPIVAALTRFNSSWFGLPPLPRQTSARGSASRRSRMYPCRMAGGIFSPIRASESVIGR